MAIRLLSAKAVQTVAGHRKLYSHPTRWQQALSLFCWH